jgi:hypothetical protein
MHRPSLIVLASTAVVCAVAAPHHVSAEIMVDFELDDNGAALGNGQIIDDAEFFTRFRISSPDTDKSHRGPTIFDSTPDGPNADGHDEDLLVDLGNILILQNTAYGAHDDSFFDVPNDEADYHPLGYGTIVFEFLGPVELMSIDLIDIDCGVIVDLTLTDVSDRTRTYHVPQKWTYDISKAPHRMGYATLHLDTLEAQRGERGRAQATGPSALLVMLAGLTVGRRRRR